MVDIHSHILPGLDDGAASIEDSLKMLDIAAKSGTTDIVATPHANSEFPFDAAGVEQAFLELSERNSTKVELHLGCDFHLSYDNLSDALINPAKYTINHGTYLMVELSDLITLPATQSALLQLVQSGIVPVITHPERNPSLQPKLGELERWVKEGCLLQVTGQSLLGRFGRDAKRAADSLLNAELVHFIASDAHDRIDRTPDLSQAYKHVSSKYGSGRADALFIHNPGSAVRGEPLSDEPSKPTKVSRLLSFWKR